jgi:hypothetical protein
VGGAVSVGAGEILDGDGHRFSTLANKIYMM